MTALVFIDVNLPMYAAGREHPLREGARRVIRDIASGTFQAVTDAEVFQEILYRYLHIGAAEQGFQVFDHFHKLMEGRILPITADDALKARELAAEHPRLGARDLIHLAVMRRNNIRRIISADRHFDGLSEVERIDPSEHR